MVQFQIDINTFLSEYWQKKPLVIRQALPNFINPLSADELAGLALEDDVESRLVLETPKLAPFWQLKQGPFVEADFNQLPKTHWTLLVQGVDRLIPEVAYLLENFNFIPQWRVDDVMISYAVKHGSVGPHYDNYDVFLYQALGQRKWSLTTKNCRPSNYLQDVPLRIMEEFMVEEEYILEPGDMLYLPPHVGHHGVSLSDDCMTYSFGFRSYQGQELWDSFGDFLSEQGQPTALYSDPNWVVTKSTALIPPQAWLNAKESMQRLLDDEKTLKNWFASFVTSLDEQAEQQLPMPLADEELGEISLFIDELKAGEGLMRDGACRVAYLEDELQLFINGCAWQIEEVASELVKYFANNRFIATAKLLPFLMHDANRLFLYELWQLQWLQLRAE